jgi:hypothetical protein
LADRPALRITAKLGEELVFEIRPARIPIAIGTKFIIKSSLLLLPPNVYNHVDGRINIANKRIVSA